MDEDNGGPSRLDRMEGLRQLLIDDHLKFDDEHRRLLTAQILLTDAQKRTDERMDKVAAAMTKLAEVSAATDAGMTILDHGDLFGGKADLFGAAAGIADGQHPDAVARAAGADRTAGGMTDGAMEQGAAEDLGGGGDLWICS